MRKSLFLFLPLLAFAPVFAYVDDALSFAYEAATPFVKQGFNVREDAWGGDLGVKDKQAIPVLARALEDGDPAVQYRAVASLKQVSGRDLGNDVNAWREWAADPEGHKAEWSIAEGFRRLF